MRIFKDIDYACLQIEPDVDVDIHEYLVSRQKYALESHDFAGCVNGFRLTDVKHLPLSEFHITLPGALAERIDDEYTDLEMKWAQIDRFIGYLTRHRTGLARRKASIKNGKHKASTFIQAPVDCIKDIIMLKFPALGWTGESCIRSSEWDNQMHVSLTNLTGKERGSISDLLEADVFKPDTNTNQLTKLL